MAAMFLSVLLVAGLFWGTHGLTVEVKRNGTDNDACLNGSESCRTFGWALRAFNSTTLRENLTIEVYYSHNFTNASGTQILNWRSVSISGQGRPVLLCPSLGTGIAFYNCTSVAITGLSFNNCAVQHPTTSLISTMPKFHFIHAFSSIFFFNSSNITIHDCEFQSKRGNGMSMYDSVGYVHMNNSWFSTNVSQELRCTASNYTCSPQSTGVYIESTWCHGFCSCVTPTTTPSAKYSLYNVTFSHCENPGAYLQTMLSYPPHLNSSEHWPFGRGGGLSIFLLGRTVRMTVEMSHVHVDSNWAQQGGGMNLQLFSQPSNNTILLESCTFQDNYANETGGGLTMGFICSLDDGNCSDSSNLIQISNTNLFNNSASTWGGGLSSYTSGLKFERPSFELIFYNCTWRENTAQLSAAAMGLTHWFEDSEGFVMTPSCFDCKFHSNHLLVLPSTSHLYGYGVLVLQGVPMAFYEYTEFVNNSASALLVSSSAATLNGNVLFQGNSALSGGGVHLMGSSWLILVQGLNLTFENNVAFQYGGGIYYAFPPSLSVKNSRTCFLQYDSDQPANVSEWNINVTFRNNVASQAGDALYISTADECIWEMEGDPFEFNSHTPFHYEQRDTKRITATPPKNMYPNLPQVERDKHMWYSYSVMPGRSVNILINVTDYFNNTAMAVVSIKCHNISTYLQYQYHEDLCDGTPYTLLNSQRVFTIEDSLTGLQFSGPKNTEFLLVMKTNDVQPLILPVLIIVTDCNLGYIYSNGICECYSHISSDHIQCVQNQDLYIPCIQRGYWFGQIGHEETGEVIYGIQTCPVDSCSGTCHQCAYLSNEVWCSLFTNEDHFCQHHRSGPLCSTCEGTYSLSYDAYECVKCTSTKIVGFVLTCVGFWLIKILEVVVIVQLRFHIGSGYAYSVLYFFTIIRYIVWYNIPGYLDVVMNIFTTFARLDPRYFIYTGLCLYPGATPVQYETLHFLHPLVILTAVFTIAAIGHYFPRLALLSGETAVQAICFLLLLAFTSLAESSSFLLLPLTYYDTYPHSDTWFVQIQPGTEYMHPNEHLPYAIVAILVLVFFVIPFALFLLLSPFLAKHFNLIKLKPFLDEYQSPFKDKYRWFAGVYLVGRELFFFTILWNVPTDTTVLLNQIFCGAILLLHAIVQPYRSRLLNAIDTAFLVGLTLLTLLYSNTGVGAIHFGTPPRDVVIGVLILLPCIYVTLSLIGGIFYWIYRTSFCKKMCCRSHYMEEREPIINHPSLTTELSSSGDFPPRLLEQESADRRSRVNTTDILAPKQLEGTALLANNDAKTKGHSAATLMHSSHGTNTGSKHSE